MPLAAALAKCFWKLTGMSDGVWEEGKIFPKAPGVLSQLGFCAPLSLSVVSYRICPVDSNGNEGSDDTLLQVFPLHPRRWDL